jgi:hypothetical protein
MQIYNYLRLLKVFFGKRRKLAGECAEKLSKRLLPGIT